MPLLFYHAVEVTAIAVKFNVIEMRYIICCERTRGEMCVCVCMCWNRLIGEGRWEQVNEWFKDFKNWICRMHYRK